MIVEGSERGSGLCLIGVRGSGKTTIGRIAAARCGRSFVDLDCEIEARSGKTIRSIFEDSGEPGFREWEKRTLAEVVLARPGSVVATGGGIVLDSDNRRKLRAHGLVVWLLADLETLAGRLEAEPGGIARRPALTNLGTLAELERVSREREPLYQGVADVVVDTSGLSAEDCGRRVFFHWQSSESIEGGLPKCGLS